NLEVRPSRGPGAYVRWKYDVKNPQIAVTADSESWLYTGDAVAYRRSHIHRTDQPCHNANHRSRYTYETEVLDDLPFPLEQIMDNRNFLCDYCFFGGPARVRASV